MHVKQQTNNIMEKIYLIESEAVFDCELIRGFRAAHKSLLKARLQYEDELNLIKSKYKEDDWEEDETDTCYEAFESGYAVQNHVCVTITELILND